MDGSNGFDKILALDVLEEIGPGAGLEGAKDVLVAAEGGKHDDAGAREFGDDPANFVDAIEAGDLDKNTPPGERAQMVSRPATVGLPGISMRVKRPCE
jgi:hypothetical protein